MLVKFHFFDMLHSETRFSGFRFSGFKGLTDKILEPNFSIIILS